MRNPPPFNPAHLGGLHFGAAYDLDAMSFFDGLIDDICIYDIAVEP